MRPPPAPGPSPPRAGLTSAAPNPLLGERSPLLVLAAVFVGGLLVVRMVFYLVLGMLVRVRHGVGLDALIVSYQIGALRFPYDVIVANAVAQAVGLGGVALLGARLHTARVSAWLHLSGAPPAAFGLALVGLLGLVPLVQLLSTFNAYLPLPSFLRTLEQTQLSLFDRVLSPDAPGVFVLVVATLALAPALFEETFFRGYVLRQSHIGRTGTGAILLSALLFALYHGRFGQLLPLLALGVYLGFVAFVSGSVWPGIVAHFVYNAGLITAAALAASPDRVPELEAWTLLPGTALVVLSMRSLLARRALPVAAAPPPSVSWRPPR